MTNSILNAITKTLHTTFGNDYHYYVEDIEQDLQTPCFTVQALNSMNRSVNKSDYYRVIPCAVHYFGTDKNLIKKESFGIGEKVLDSIEYIEVGGRTLRGEDMEYTITDDVLVIFITYSFWTEKVTEDVEPSMEVLNSIEPTLE